MSTLEIVEFFVAEKGPLKQIANLSHGPMETGERGCGLCDGVFYQLVVLWYVLSPNCDLRHSIPASWLLVILLE